MKRTRILAAFLCAALASSWGAGLSVPAFGIITNGSVDEAGQFGLSSRIALEMLVQGGAKFAAWFSLGFNSISLEDYLAALYSSSPLPDTITGNEDELIAAVRRLEEANGFGLKTAAISFTHLFGGPLDLAFFVGKMDTIASGSDYPALYGTVPFATKLRGFLYYPGGIAKNPALAYDGLHEVYGTGFRLALPGAALTPYLYFYQDSWLGSGKYSADARFQLNTEAVKLEAFAGASFPDGAFGSYRGGLLFFYDTGVIGSFYAQVGIPRWNPTEAFDMALFYFLFEPRFDFGPGNLILTVFHHPRYYAQAPTGEEGQLELRVDLGFGDLGAGTPYGGVETAINYDPNSSSLPVSISAGPYIHAYMDGVKIELRLDTRVFPVSNPWYGMFSPSLGLSAAF